MALYGIKSYCVYCNGIYWHVIFSVFIQALGDSFTIFNSKENAHMECV